MEHRFLDVFEVVVFPHINLVTKTKQKDGERIPPLNMLAKWTH